MVVMQSKAGQLANRLFAFSHFIGNSIEYGYRLVNPSFDEYCVHFPACEENRFDGLPISVRMRPQMSFSRFRKTTEWLRRRLPSSPWHEFVVLNDDVSCFDLADAAFVQRARHKAIFVQGWQFRDNASLRKHHGAITRFLKPRNDTLDEVLRSASQARQGADVLVGVHIRRGDYANWQGGRYFYADAVYASAMLSVQAALAQEGRKASFLICSNEAIDPAAFIGVTSSRGPGSAVADLYALAQCELLMGPPSTFSLWAAYYGKARYYHIVDPSAQPSLVDFGEV